jgi:sulfonate transport system permease protein
VTRTRTGRLALLLVGPVGLILLVWRTSEGSTSSFYPPLSDVLTALQDDWLFEQVGTDLLPSLGRFGAGYVLAAVGGVAAGTALGLAPRLRRASQPVTEFLRSVPPPLMLPFVLVTLGIGNDSKVAVIALGSVWPVLLNTVDGVRGVAPETLDMARAYGLRPAQRVRRVVLPGASPQIAVGLRTALSVALILMIISEMRATTNGLGFRVLEAQRRFDAAGTYAGVIVIGMVGLVLNLAFLLAEGRIMRWHRGSRGLLDEGRSAGRPGTRSADAASMAAAVPAVGGAA